MANRESSENQADLDTIAERLAALDEQADRQLDAALKQIGVARSDFFGLRCLAERLDGRSEERARKELEERLPPAELSWERLSRPSLSNLNRRGLQLLQA